MVTVALHVVGDAPERLREALRRAAEIGVAEGLGQIIEVTDQVHHPADLVATIAADVLPDARAVWRLAAALDDPSVDVAMARQLPLESPGSEPPHSLVVARPGAAAGRTVVVCDAVVFRDERLPDDPTGPVEPGAGIPAVQWLRGTGLAADAADRLETAIASYADGPFLSVVMRTQGRRSQELREALLSLAAQTSSDFEVLVVVHRAGPEELVLVERLVADQPPSLRDRIRMLRLDEGGRAAPLNLGLEQARGRYVGIVDDDDIVLAHWVESHAAAERALPGSLLRSVVLVQEVESAAAGLRATGPVQNFYAPRFSLAQHLVANQSPTLGWALPRWLIREGRLRFDDTMTTTEDWELLLRAAELAGVTDTGRATAIYRRYGERESSRTDHPEEEWRRNQEEIERRTDSRPVLISAGETAELRRLRHRVRELAQARSKLRAKVQRAREDVAALEAEVAALRAERAAGNRGSRRRLRRSD